MDMDMCTHDDNLPSLGLFISDCGPLLLSQTILFFQSDLILMALPVCKCPCLISGIRPLFVLWRFSSSHMCSSCASFTDPTLQLQNRCSK